MGEWETIRGTTITDAGHQAVATKDVRPYHVNVGVPAKSIAVKPSAPAEHARAIRIPPPRES